MLRAGGCVASGDGTSSFTGLARLCRQLSDGAYDNRQVTGAGALAYTGDRRSLIGNGWAFGKATHNFNGLIDEVRIYTRALPESEVREIYESQK